KDFLRLLALSGLRLYNAAHADCRAVPEVRRAVHRGEEIKDWNRARLLEGRLRLGTARAGSAADRGAGARHGKGLTSSECIRATTREANDRKIPRIPALGEELFAAHHPELRERPESVPAVSFAARNGAAGGCECDARDDPGVCRLPARSKFGKEFGGAEAGGVAVVLQILCARRNDQGKSRAARADSEIAEADSVGALRGRDERVPESTGHDAAAAARRARGKGSGRFRGAGKGAAGQSGRRRPVAEAGPRAARTALCGGIARERADRSEPGAHRPPGAHAARARQREQRAYCAVRIEGPGGARSLLAGARATPGASGIAWQTSAGPAHGGGFSELRGSAAHAALRGANRQKIRAAGQRQLGFASAFAAARVCDAPAGGRRGFARDSGAPGPPVAFHDAEVHPRIHPPVDGRLRQIASARVAAGPSPGHLYRFPDSRASVSLYAYANLAPAAATGAESARLARLDFARTVRFAPPGRVFVFRRAGAGKLRDPGVRRGHGGARPHHARISFQLYVRGIENDRRRNAADQSSVSRDHRNHARIQRLVRNGILYFHFRAQRPGMGLRGQPHPAQSAHSGKMALARGLKPFERNRLAKPEIFGGYLDVGDAPHHRQADRPLVFLLQSDI